MSIQVTDAALNTLYHGFEYRCRVESWLAGVLLADDVPVSAGHEEADRALAVPERVTLTVPRWRDGFDWSPGDDDGHPLAANGQRLRVSLGIGVGNGVTEWFQRGEFVIYKTEPFGDSVLVDARGLLHLVDEARLVSPYQPTGTFESTLRGLVEPALTVAFHSALVDRAVPGGINFDEDRLSAVGEVLDAWPAQARTTADGYLRVEPVGTSAGDAYLYTQGIARTVLEMVGESTREGAYTVVVARGTAADGAQVQGVAYDSSTGPHAHGGPFNPLPVPFYFSSPLLTTVAQARAAAQTILARKQRETVRPKRLTCAPHPVLQLGDRVRLNDDASQYFSVESYRLPYTAGGGAMDVTVREVL